jgi:hypothetical protein
VWATVTNNVMQGIEYPLWGDGSLVNNIVGAVTGSIPDIGPAPIDVGSSDSGGSVTPPEETPTVPVDTSGGDNAPVDAGGTDTPPIEVGSDTPPDESVPVDGGGDAGAPIDVGGDVPVDGGTDVAVDQPVEAAPEPAPEPDPAPQWQWGGWWNNGDQVGFTGWHHHWHNDWT